MRKEPAYHYPYLWPVGPGGMVATERIIAAGRWESAPIRRAVRKARAEGRVIDLTYGHACQWVLFLDSGHLALATEPMPVAVDDRVFLTRMAVGTAGRSKRWTRKRNYYDRVESAGQSGTAG